MQNKYDVTIGLEIHIESKTKSKMFCSCLNDPNEKTPNINICPICMGHPGTYPKINEQAINNIIKLGLALNCLISKCTKFDRKHYFYPDLPKGYQISQMNYPICQSGHLNIGDKTIRINRIHQEEDAGKLIHEKNESLIDFNRAGVPLIELVTEPDFNSKEEVIAFAKELQLIARYLNISDANMEKGEMRIEVNLSLKEKQDKELGTKVEVKNLNSFKTVEKAIEYEMQRQASLLNKGERIEQETRGFDEQKQGTVSQRLKKESHEYRYMPDPDLPILELTDKRISKIKCEIPELPQAKRQRFKKEYGIDDKKILEIFVENKEFGAYFEKVATELLEWMNAIKINKAHYFDLIKLTCNYLTSDLIGLAKGEIIDFSHKIDPENFAELITIIHKGDINSKIAKIVLKEMYDYGSDPSHIIEDKGLKQIDDKEEVRQIIKEVLASNKSAVLDYKKGKTASLQFLIGQTMAKSKGKIHPDKAKQVLLKELENI
ncbi:MAG: Asp-tRNA(Asn)/Glu-tRNA(Gln) amidotransferase subunit GatB [Candidatus Pacebacteria bacterium]|nr:Asp-tRNA(Asn)/Glu-tRNA(Gln) amidotransferase subunit GatB [Candidatus Paceibacterota bacterium]